MARFLSETATTAGWQISPLRREISVPRPFTLTDVMEHGGRYMVAAPRRPSTEEPAQLCVRAGMEDVSLNPRNSGLSASGEQRKRSPPLL